MLKTFSSTQKTKSLSKVREMLHELTTNTISLVSKPIPKKFDLHVIYSTRPLITRGYTHIIYRHNTKVFVSSIRAGIAIKLLPKANYLTVD